MAKEFKIQATVRQDVGKGASRRLRGAEQVPAIVYGIGKESQTITLNHKMMMRALEDESFYARILDLEIDGKTEKVVLKDLQRHPYKPRLTHVDFLRISEAEKLTMLIPLHFMGEDVAPGVKIDGGIVSHLLSEATVRCLPKHLPEFITVDVSQLNLNQTVHLSNLQLPPGVELVNLIHGEDKPVVTIHIPRAVVEPTEVVSAAAVPASEVSAEEPAKAAEGAEKGREKGKEKEKE